MPLQKAYSSTGVTNASVLRDNSCATSAAEPEPVETLPVNSDQIVNDASSKLFEIMNAGVTRQQVSDMINNEQNQSDTKKTFSRKKKTPKKMMTNKRDASKPICKRSMSVQKSNNTMKVKDFNRRRCRKKIQKMKKIQKSQSYIPQRTQMPLVTKVLKQLAETPNITKGTACRDRSQCRKGRNASAVVNNCAATSLTDFSFYQNCADSLTISSRNTNSIVSNTNPVEILAYVTTSKASVESVRPQPIDHENALPDLANAKASKHSLPTTSDNAIQTNRKTDEDYPELIRSNAWPASIPFIQNGFTSTYVNSAQLVNHPIPETKNAVIANLESVDESDNSPHEVSSQFDAKAFIKNKIKLFDIRGPKTQQNQKSDAINTLFRTNSKYSPSNKGPFVSHANAEKIQGTYNPSVSKASVIIKNNKVTRVDNDRSTPAIVFNHDTCSYVPDPNASVPIDAGESALVNISKISATADINAAVNPNRSCHFATTTYSTFLKNKRKSKTLLNESLRCAPRGASHEDSNLDCFIIEGQSTSNNRVLPIAVQNKSEVKNSNGSSHMPKPIRSLQNTKHDKFVEDRTKRRRIAHKPRHPLIPERSSPQKIGFHLTHVRVGRSVSDSEDAQGFDTGPDDDNSSSSSESLF